MPLFNFLVLSGLCSKGHGTCPANCIPISGLPLPVQQCQAGKTFQNQQELQKSTSTDSENNSVNKSIGKFEET